MTVISSHTLIGQYKIKTMHVTLISLAIIALTRVTRADLFQNERMLHARHVTDFTHDQIKQLSNMANFTHFKHALDNILVERVVNTPGHAQVKQFIINCLRDAQFHVERHAFVDETPLGRVTFENIIGTLNPNAKRYLVLACHYDSKIDANGVFLGATDSAVPCAMLLNVIHVLASKLSREARDVSLRLVFFDGEEALRRWGPKDSLYGARKLAAKWSQAPIEYNARAGSELDRIDMLVLLDLLGAANPKFYSYFPTTRAWYEQMSGAELELVELNELSCKGECARTHNVYFQRQSMPSYVEDDHTPFLIKGVPVLHIIPTPFPRVWHTLDDNLSAISFRTVKNLNKILTVFVAKYLMLDI